jgi:histidinol-phosphate aminotransferase
VSLSLNPWLSAIEPYVGGDASLSKSSRQQTNIHRLMSNENPLGYSSKAREAIAKVNDFAIYPDSSHTTLKQALCQALDLQDPSWIVCGNGSDEVIGFIAQAFINPSRSMVYNQYGFLMYPLAVKAMGGLAIQATATAHYSIDIDAMLDAIRADTSVVFIANPNNPTGTYINYQTLVALRERLREDIILVIDCAYAEYATAADYGNAFKLVENYHNVIVTRTFSKLHGLAALRCGFCYAKPEIATCIEQALRMPFNVNKIAQVASAASIEDQAFIEGSIWHNTKYRELFTTLLSQYGQVIPSQANFVLWLLADAKQADSYYQLLVSNGIYVRKVSSYGINNALRVTIGSENSYNYMKVILEQASL